MQHFQFILITWLDHFLALCNYSTLAVQIEELIDPLYKVTKERPNTAFLFESIRMKQLAVVKTTLNTLWGRFWERAFCFCFLIGRALWKRLNNDQRQNSTSTARSVGRVTSLGTELTATKSQNSVANYCTTRGNTKLHYAT